ncbi:MAG: cobalamin-dependent protein [Pseudomonadota bacterium]
MSRSALREDLLEELIAAVMCFDNAPREAVLARFTAAGVSRAKVVDRYIPAAAQKLGAAWCEDQMSFADVTIGSARLQAMLRDMRAPQVTDPGAQSVLVAVPQDAYHTLGASVLADQLRRFGIAPHMALGLGLGELSELVETHDYNAVLISAASSQRLESIRDIVNCIRTASRSNTPIVLGGSVMDIDTDIKTLTGADYVSNNPEEALRACGLTIPVRAVAPPGHSGSGG